MKEITQTVSAQETDTEADPMAIRLLVFVRRKGGPSEVARNLGIKPSIFYQFEAGRSKPSSDTLRLFASYYEDFDPMYILTGKKATVVAKTVNTQASESIEVMRLQTENEGYKREIERLEDTITIIRGWIPGFQGDSRQVGKFESANNSTSATSQLLIGYTCPSRKKDRTAIVTIPAHKARPITRIFSNRTGRRS